MKTILGICCGLGFILLGCTRSGIETGLRPSSYKVWSIYGEIPHMNPFYATDVKVWGLQSLVWDPFIVLNKNGQWEKGVVQSWEFAPDFKVGQFSVVPDLVWSDGTPVTAQDFIFSLSFYQFKELKAAHWQGVFDPIQTVEFEGNRLTITLEKAQGFEVWNQILSMARLLPASALATDSFTLETLKNTGPYRIQNFSSTKTWRMEKNSNSWWYTSSLSPRQKLFKGQELPQVLLLQKALSKSVIQRGLDKGRFDAFVDYGQLELEPIGYHPVYQQKMAKNLVFNFTESRFQNMDFRRCLLATLPTPEQLQKLDYKGMRFDWSQTQRDSLKGKEVSSLCFSRPGTTVPKGFQGEVSVHYVLDQDRKWLEVWQENAQKWGIALNLIAVGESKLAKLLQEKKYQILISESLLDHVDQWPYEVFFSKGLYNSQSWRDQKLDELLKTKSSLIDFHKRQELNAQISEHILESLGIIYVYEWVRPLAWTRAQCQDKSHFLWWNLLSCMGAGKKTP